MSALSTFLAMECRFYLGYRQFVIRNLESRTVCFLQEGRSINHYFTLSYDQFLAFHDCIQLIRHSPFYGHYPLGGSKWFHFSIDAAVLYSSATPDHFFRFENFEKYIRRAHQDTLDVFRDLRAEWRDERKIGACKRENEGGDDGEYPSGKRSLSNAMQSSVRVGGDASPSGRQTSLGATPDVIDVHTRKESDAVSEWNNTTPGRWHDTSAFPNSIPIDTTDDEESLWEPDCVSISLEGE